MKERLLVGALGLFILLYIPACDVLDLSPEQDLDNEMVFEDASAAEAAVRGMYDALQEGGMFGGIGIMAADFTADAARFIGSFTTYQNIRDYSPLQSTNGAVQEVWAHSYDAINRANAVLEGIDEVPEMSDARKAEIRGEALFVRAIAHHHLVRWFGQPYQPGATNDQPGVPISLEATREPGEHLNLPRASVADVYNQVISDLQEAEGLVPEDFASASDTHGRATVGAVRGMLARVALYQSDWEGVEDYTGMVLDSPLYSLSSTPQAAFPSDNSAEDVFSVQNRPDDQIGVNAAIHSFAQPDGAGGRGDMPAAFELIDAYEEDDLRLIELFYLSPDYPDEAGHWTGKFTSSQQADNIPVIRVADVILMRAEALAELGETDDALDLLNEIRDRANASEYTEADFADADELVELILHERWLELAFEGHRRHDFLRRGHDIESYQIGTVEFGSNRTIYPIPDRDITVNPALEQNPGY